MTRSFTTEFHSSPVRAGAGEALAAHGTGVDQMDRKQLEEQLLRAQRLEAVGRLAGQVAHDLNNLLGQLVGYPELIKETLPEGHQAIAFCDAITRAAQRIIDINADVLALSRRALLDQQSVDLNQLAEQATELVADAPDGLTIKLDLAPDVPPINGSASQLWRVLSNLIVNARDAMHDFGELQIKTENVYLDQPLDRYNVVQVGSCAKLSVSDTGCGIPAEITDRIFEAFFTTKKTGPRHGSGLGLSVVKAIVDDHKGYVDVKSIPGKGTTFSLYFPITKEATPAARGGAPSGGIEALRTLVGARRPTGGSCGPGHMRAKASS